MAATDTVAARRPPPSSISESEQTENCTQIDPRHTPRGPRLCVRKIYEKLRSNAVTESAVWPFVHSVSVFSSVQFLLFAVHALGPVRHYRGQVHPSRIRIRKQSTRVSAFYCIRFFLLFLFWYTQFLRAHLPILGSIFFLN